MLLNATVLRADFNGLCGDLLCLSHGEPCRDASGSPVELSEGLRVIAFEDDSFENKPSYLVASGSIESAPEELACLGSRWVLHIDIQGVRNVAEIPSGT
jgi:hypothetical protein